MSAKDYHALATALESLATIPALRESLDLGTLEQDWMAAIIAYHAKRQQDAASLLPKIGPDATAERLKCSRRTVYRLLHRWRKRVPETAA